MLGPGKISRFIERTSVVLSWVAVSFFLVAMMLLVTADVFCRYVLNQPIKGAFEIVCLMLVVVVFFTLSYCWVQGGHIRIEFVIQHFSPRWRAAMNALGAGSGLSLLILLVWQAGLDTVDSVALNELTDRLLLPVWPVRALMTFGGFVFMVQLLASLVISLRQVIGLRG